jgi:hypothetical protein
VSPHNWPIVRPKCQISMTRVVLVTPRVLYGSRHVSCTEAATCPVRTDTSALYGLPRVAFPICHVSSSPSATCRLLVGPRQLYGPATSAVRTDTCLYGLYGQVQSASKICLFGFSDRTRYLPHTDSVCDKNYTTGFRKTRRTQWHRFRRIPSTFIFEHF